MNDKLLEQYRNNLLTNKFNKEKESLENTIISFNNEFPRFYRHCFPLRLHSYYLLKKFGENMSQFELLPNLETYKILNTTNELFDANLTIFIKKGKKELLFNIPFLINISKLSEYVIESNMQPQILKLDIINPIINPSCIEEFDQDMLHKKQGRDMLEEVKASNPIIMMVKSEIAQPYIINGNHRIIQAMRDGKKTVNAYIVTPKLCSQFGITEDYERLYSEILVLYKKVYGVVKI